ncbi:MAG: SRPBCC family protein [Bryobacterales bacterium]|nr:SRPBCC family protein [Bryobacterales bacterium]MEB2362825.1 SRPBCC family protein [Bryobacterales bacterium]
MSEFERTATIEAPAGDVFRFVSNVSNFPLFVPSVQDASVESGDRVRMRGVSEGHAYDTVAYLRADIDRKRLDWGSEDNARYRGWLEVKSGDTTPDLSEVTIHLYLGQMTSSEQNAEDQPSDFEEKMQGALAGSLASIRMHVVDRRVSRSAPPS